jgi:hypothetical protein
MQLMSRRDLVSVTLKPISADSQNCKVVSEKISSKIDSLTWVRMGTNLLPRQQMGLQLKLLPLVCEDWKDVNY